MLHRLKHFNLLTALLLMLSAVSVRAITFMEVESAYEGDGWFRYTLTFPPDQFTPYARIGDFTPTGFDQASEVSTPEGWTYASRNNGIGWLRPQPHPSVPQHMSFVPTARCDTSKRQLSYLP